MQIAVNEVFGPTVQGEGPSIGTRAMFLRLVGCNLSCAWCDTPYTWDWAGVTGKAYSKANETQLTDVIPFWEGLKAACHANHVPLLVITGGEPLLQQKALVHALRECGPPNAAIEIETNGTVVPDKYLLDNAGVFFNVSPKLMHSGNDERRLNMKALDAFVGSERASFKFVVETRDDLVEIGRMLDSLTWISNATLTNRVWVMPQARTQAGIYDTLKPIADDIVRHGYNISTRLHVELWGDERGR